MSDPMTMKWAIIDLLKICDAANEGRLHGDLARIARTLGVELTSPVIEAPIDLGKAKKAASASAAPASAALRRDELRRDEKGAI